MASLPQSQLQSQINLSTQECPPQSSLSKIISKNTTESNTNNSNSQNESLALEILYNLQYQHKWTDLSLYQISPSPSPSQTQTQSQSQSQHLIRLPYNTNTTKSSDQSTSPLLPLPPSSSSSSTSISNPNPTKTRDPSSSTSIIISGLPPRHSYIHPDFLSHLVQHDIAETDVPIQREWVIPMSIGEKWTLKRFSAVFDFLPEREAVEGFNGFKHRDSRRVLLGMLGHNGMGGDGTVVYYIMQEGDVKPRQN